MKKKYALLILIILMTGCAYYNTFYNAEKYFKDAQEMELRDNGKPSPSAIQKYNKVIKKCGIVITDYPKSDYADDAVMLLAKTFFYKGTNYGQAAEKFNDILTYYPNSEFVPDTHLFLARISYQLKKKEEAYSKLREFIQNPEFEDHHPKALIILANYQLQDKKLAEADFYFNQVITNYPQSKEYETAFFARGKTFYLAEKYDDSNKVFYDLLKSRVGKQIKLDSRYYIALNFLLTEQYNKAENEAKKLIKSESRLVEISKIELLLARAKAGNEQVDEAIGLCENIIQNNKGSFLAAETSYYLAEFYFNYKKNYEKAIEYYNNVKKERKKSPFVKEALGKSVVAAQIIQYYQPDSEISQDELVLQQFNLAEHYVNTLEMPDSAIVVYNNIILDKQKFELQLDSLEISK
ncbi:MAG: tetratricopeptide repeat protein, partial [Candidatus Cloacimonetes bacterium]|nr:tetratricopeptide repeat protein [Candidatus Cloacimonadota bacterium]